MTLFKNIIINVYIVNIRFLYFSIDYLVISHKLSVYANLLTFKNADNQMIVFKFIINYTPL